MGSASAWHGIRAASANEGNCTDMKRLQWFWGLTLMMAAAVAAQAAPKNVILMVTDGRSHAAVEATTYWRGAPPIYAGKQWIKGWASTYSASNDFVSNPLGYDPSRAWEPDGAGGLKPNLSYLKSNATDSASGISSIATGVKIKDSQINLTPDGKPLRNLAQLFHAAGNATGAVTTVPFPHATPAGVGAHARSRNDYLDISEEMLTKSGLDVIIGAGNPDYDDNGKRTSKPGYTFVSERNWTALQDGSLGYRLIQGREEFQNLAAGATDKTPSRLVGIFQARNTAQQGRGKYEAKETPGSVPRNQNVPTLSEMTLAALNVLNKNPRGFFLLVEGGAIDWAAHANQAARLIEEHMEFDDTVAAVSSWVEAHGGWDRNLVIITSDHGTGMITGPNGETRVVDNGKGAMPGLRFNHNSHANVLVPVYARGASANAVKVIVRDVDPVRGPYLDNTDIFRIIVQAAGVL